jgi:hypothetical protein
LPEATQTDKKTAGVFLDTLGALGRVEVGKVTIAWKNEALKLD